MRVLVALALVLSVVAHASAVDFQARYPSQTVFDVEGKPYGSLLFAAEPGVTVTTYVHVRANEDVAADTPFTLTATVDGNATASADHVWPAGTASPLRLNVSWVVPVLEPGTHAAGILLEVTDDNAANNNPREVPFRVGAAQVSTIAPTRMPWLGPVLALALIATPFALRTGPVARMGTNASRATQHLWERATATWIHLPAPQRSIWGAGIVLGSATLGVVVLVLAAGRIAVGARGVLEAFVLASVLAALIAAATAIKHRAWRPVLRPATISLGTAFALGLLWQQAAAVTTLLRWPSPGALVPFAVLGLSIGAIYALIALGYTMVYGILKFINFAHGEVFLWGGYFAWVFVVQFPILPVWIAVLVSIVLTAALGAGIERIAYRPLRGGDRLTPLITAIAVSLLLAALAQMVFGTGRRTFTEPGTYAGTPARSWLTSTRDVLGAELTHLDLVVMATALTLMVALGLYISRSRMGQAMRAVADDMETARTVGIPVDRVVTTTFVLGSGLAAVGGVFWGLRFSLYPTLGLLTGIKAFTAAVVGGIGNIHGAFLGGLLIGLAENVGSQFMDSRFLNAITVAVLLLFLLLRPQGLLPGPGGSDRK